MSTKTTILIHDLSLLGLWEALSALSEEGMTNDAAITVELTETGGMYRITGTNPPAHRGVKQRCAAKDADGRRCIRGPRHRENHRYEDAE